jgi:hypothetical protein
MERKWWTLLAVCLGTFMLLVDVTIVNVALPRFRTPAGHAHGLATAFSQGEGPHVLAALPPAARRTAADVARLAFVSGLNEILVVSGVGALLAAVAAVALIRGRDFVASAQARPATPAKPGVPVLGVSEGP